MPCVSTVGHTGLLDSEERKRSLRCWRHPDGKGASSVGCSQGGAEPGGKGGEGRKGEMPPGRLEVDKSQESRERGSQGTWIYLEEAYLDNLSPSMSRGRLATWANGPVSCRRDLTYTGDQSFLKY